MRLADKRTFHLSLISIHPAGHPSDGFAGSAVEMAKPVDHVQNHPYTLDKMERGFADRGFCKLAEGGRDFMTLTDLPVHGDHYDFPAGSSVLLIEDNDTGFVVISDDTAVIAGASLR